MFTTTAVFKHPAQPAWMGSMLLSCKRRIEAGEEALVELVQGNEVGSRTFRIVGGEFDGVLVGESFLSFTIPEPANT